jgi:hypothetical protein
MFGFLPLRHDFYLIQYYSVPRSIKLVCFKVVNCVVAFALFFLWLFSFLSVNSAMKETHTALTTWPPFFIHVLRIVCPMQMYKRSLTKYDLLLNKKIFIIVYTSSVGTSLLFEILSRSLSLGLSPGFMKCMLFLDVVAKTPENSLYVSIRFLLEYVRRWKKKHMIIYARRDFTNLCARMKYWIIHRLTWLCVGTTCVCFLLHLAIIMLMNFFFLYILQIDDSIHITYRTEEMSNIFEASSNYSIMHQNRQSTSSSPTVTRRRYSHLFR